MALIFMHCKGLKNFQREEQRSTSHVELLLIIPSLNDG